MKEEREKKARKELKENENKKKIVGNTGRKTNTKWKKEWKLRKQKRKYKEKRGDM